MPTVGAKSPWEVGDLVLLLESLWFLYSTCAVRLLWCVHNSEIFRLLSWSHISWIRKIYKQTHYFLIITYYYYYSYYYYYYYY